MDESTLYEKIEKLDRLTTEALNARTNRGLLFKNIWTAIREISASFKETRFASGNARQVAWENFQKIVQRVKEDQENHFKARHKSEQTSQELLDKIIRQTERAWPHEDGFQKFLAAITGAELFANIITAGIEKAIELASFGLLKSGPKDDRKEELNICSANIKEAWELYKQFRDDLIPSHRDAARKVLVSTQGELDKEWAAWKLEKNSEWENRRQQFERNANRKRTLVSEMRGLARNQADAEARKRVKELFQEWRTVGLAGKETDEELWAEFKNLNDSFWEQSQEAFEKNKASFRERTRSQIEKLEGMLERAKENLEKNQLQLATARGEDFQDTVKGWIEENEAHIERIEGWLEEQQDRLRNS